MSMIDIIKTKFAEQKAKGKTPAKCPYCDKEIEFKFEHTQNTTVATTLVGIVKKGEKLE